LWLVEIRATPPLPDGLEAAGHAMIRKEVATWMSRPESFA
jgi:hypothetical protein